MNKFTGVDYFQMESLYSEEEILVRNSVREFVDHEIIPIIEKQYMEGKFPFELIPN